MDKYWQSLKEQYLTYRQLHLGDSTDVFTKRQLKEQSKTKLAGSTTSLSGPTPFTGMSNTAAAAMAAALNRAQQPLVTAQGWLTIFESQLKLGNLYPGHRLTAQGELTIFRLQIKVG